MGWLLRAEINRLAAITEAVAAMTAGNSLQPRRADGATELTTGPPSLNKSQKQRNGSGSHLGIGGYPRPFSNPTVSSSSPLPALRRLGCPA